MAHRLKILIKTVNMCPQKRSPGNGTMKRRIRSVGPGQTNPIVQETELMEAGEAGEKGILENPVTVKL